MDCVADWSTFEKRELFVWIFFWLSILFLFFGLEEEVLASQFGDENGFFLYSTMLVLHFIVLLLVYGMLLSAISYSTLWNSRKVGL